MRPHELPPLGPAPPIEATAWLNADAPIALDGLRGRVVLLHAFQMLCPGCVLHGVPQAQRVAQLARDDLARIFHQTGPKFRRRARLSRRVDD
jgi:hypothetical protein